jgi:hypothetical protein
MPRARQLFNPECFFIDPNKPVGSLSVQPEIWLKVKAGYAAREEDRKLEEMFTAVLGLNKLHQEPMHRCPAGFTPGSQSNSTVLVEFCKWVVDIAIQHYAPTVADDFLEKSWYID